MLRPVLLLVRRDLRLTLRQGADAALAVFFFVLGVMLFPFGVGPDQAMLARIGSGILWIMALLACLLPLDRLFAADHEDGSLDLLALAPLPLELAVLAKATAHWLTSGLPLLFAAPVLALLLGLPGTALPALLLALLLGTPALSLIGAIGAALALGARRGGMLLPLLVLPLYIPVLVFGAAAVEAALAGLSPSPHLLLLGGLLLAALALAPWAAAAGLRQALD